MLTWYQPHCSAKAANGSSSPDEVSCVNSRKEFPPDYIKSREINNEVSTVIKIYNAHHYSTALSSLSVPVSFYSLYMDFHFLSLYVLYIKK